MIPLWLVANVLPALRTVANKKTAKASFAVFYFTNSGCAGGKSFTCGAGGN
jgi:hypothetical protein